MYIYIFIFVHLYVCIYVQLSWMSFIRPTKFPVETVGNCSMGKPFDPNNILVSWGHIVWLDLFHLLTPLSFLIPLIYNGK